MSHYEERLQADLAKIRGRVDEIGKRVQEAIARAVDAFVTDDRNLAGDVILGDRPVNRDVRDLDRLCHAFVVRHLPSAGHLRFVSSVLRLNVELERIGDYAVTVGRETVQISTAPPRSVIQDIELLAGQSVEALGQALEAFRQGNAELARGTWTMADQTRGTFQKAFNDLLHEGKKESRPIKDLLAFLVVLTSIGRVADQAKNICEQTVFAVTGEVKSERVYRILFVDRENACLSQMAAAFARKAFPESGEYDSAGWEPAEALDVQCRQFLDRSGFDVASAQISAVPTLTEQLSQYHLVVGLEPGVRKHLPATPFRTVVLEWDIDSIPPDLDAERTQAMLEASFKDLAGRIRALMDTLRGDEAD